MNGKQNKKANALRKRLHHIHMEKVITYESDPKNQIPTT